MTTTIKQPMLVSDYVLLEKYAKQTKKTIAEAISFLLKEKVVRTSKKFAILGGENLGQALSRSATARKDARFERGRK